MANEINPYVENVKTSGSVIEINPIDVVEKIGKHQFVYDYNAIPSLFYQNPALIHIKTPNSSGFFNFDGDGTGLTNFNPYIGYTVNPNAQVGVFSKGNIVNVVRFQGNNAIIENVNYKEPDPKMVKTLWGELLGGVINKRQLEIPKEYLIKVNDALEPTLLTGINYGANMKPQPIKTSPIFTNPVEVKPYVEPKPYLVIEEFKLKNYYSDWRTKETLFTELPIEKGSVVFLPTYSMQDQYDLALQQGKLQELPIVSVVSLVDRQTGKCKTDGALIQNMLYDPCRTVKKGEILTGYIANGVFTNTNQDTMKPQLYFGEYKLAQTNDSLNNNTNSGSVVPAEIDNKNLLMIVGAFLLGLALFNNNSAKTNN